MAELGFLARLVLTLLLSALSLFVYKWLQTPSPTAARAPAKRPKKRSRKKSAKKSASSDSPSPLPPQQSQEKPQVSSVPNKSLTAAELIGDDDDVSDSDSDDGLSAGQVLATRKFKPKNLGGSRLARKIQATLPPADAPRFAVDQEVLARFGGGDEWFPAIVLEQRKANAYHLKYDDGEVEYRVPAEFIKLRPNESDENDDGSGDGGASAAGAVQVTEGTVVQEGQSDLSESDDDEGWQVVGTSSVSKREGRRMETAAPAEQLVDGLTKRQRESRRKKERQREKKELLRQNAQKDDLDARARWRYAPS